VGLVVTVLGADTVADPRNGPAARTVRGFDRQGSLT
jgi:hypothetical protein